MSTTATVPEQPQVAPNAEPQPPAAEQGEKEAFSQSYTLKIPKTQEALQEIFTDPTTKEMNWKALLYTVRAGAKQIISNRVRQKFTEKNEDGTPTFTPLAEHYDATPLLLEAPQRKILSQRDKLEKQLKASSLSPSAIEGMLKMFDDNVGSGEEATGSVAVEITAARVVWGGKDGKQLIMKVGSASDEEEGEE